MAKKEDGTIYFDADEQSKVDEIVKERLSRVDKKPEDYEDLKEIATILEDFDWKGTPAEKKAALKAYQEDLKRQQQPPSAGQDEFKKYDEIPSEKVLEALAKKLGMAPDKVEKAIAKSIKDDEEDEKKRQANEAWDKELKEFNEKHNDVDVDKLNGDQKFLKFCKGKVGSLTDIYEDFLDFIGDAEKEFVEKVKANSDRSTSSGRGKGSADGGTYGLSDEEKAFVDEHNRRYPKLKMTYKEYGERKRR